MDRRGWSQLEDDEKAEIMERARLSQEPKEPMLDDETKKNLFLIGFGAFLCWLVMQIVGD